MVLLAGCMRPGTGRAPRPSPAPAGAASIMGTSALTGAQLAQWFLTRQPQPGGVFSATVPVATLTEIYVQEGAAEGVRGDIAFIQGIVELTIEGSGDGDLDDRGGGEGRVRVGGGRLVTVVDQV